MAGIAGVDRKDAGTLVLAMLDTMTHRGPDGCRVPAEDDFTFGMIALSAGPSAAVEPLSRNGKSVVWDGELYNFEDLQSEAKVEAVSDEDLLLKLYENEGRDFIGRLNGPFALALRDGDRTLLARDVMGQAPLYYGYREGRLCFASEMKALQKATDDIQALPPGHIFDGELRPFEIKTPDVTMPEDPESIASGLLQRLERAVEIRAAGDRPLGSWLSGGLDSATMAALASRYRSPLHH